MRDGGFLQRFVSSFSVPFRSLLSTETSGDTDPSRTALFQCAAYCIVNGLRAGRAGFESRQEKQCPLSALPSGYQCSCTAGVVMNTNFYTVPKLRKGGAEPTLPLHASIVCIRTPLPLLLPVP
jgi:hypothetical protein